MAMIEAGRNSEIQPLIVNNFALRLARNASEVEAAQALRYRIFYEEMTAEPSPEMKARHRDFDAFDDICDHLLAIDMEPEHGGFVVAGTYRLLRRSVALRHWGFYSEKEYDVADLLSFPGEIVELGRSCVDPAYRSRGVLKLLWRALANYVAHYDIDLLFGCASFPGTEPDAMRAPLAYLNHYHMAPQGLRPRALDQRYVGMNLLPPSEIDVQAALGDLPPLIKGYLRLGGFVGDGAVVDWQFNTTDVCMIVKTDQVTKKYERHYKRSAADPAGS